MSTLCFHFVFVLFFFFSFSFFFFFLSISSARSFSLLRFSLFRAVSSSFEVPSFSYLLLGRFVYFSPSLIHLNTTVCPALLLLTVHRTHVN